MHALRAPLALAAIVALAVPAARAASDNILSANVKEADGTTGQDTNSGAGVKTGHIQNGAITAPKIAAGAVGATQLAPGAVTDDQVLGPISAAKLGAHTHTPADVLGLDALLSGKAEVNHTHVMPLPRYANVVTVAKEGGDFTNPLEAMNSITNASETNPYLLKIMPGVYDIGFAVLVGKDYVDIEGSGPDVTKLTSPSLGWKLGTIGYYLVSHSQLRDITIESYGNVPNVCGTGSAIEAIAVGLAAAAPTLFNVKLRALGGTGNTALYMQGGGRPTLTSVELSADASPLPCGMYAHGVYASGNDAGPVIRSATINVVGGQGYPNQYAAIFANEGARLTLSNVDALAPQYGIRVGGHAESPVHVTVTASRFKAATAISNLGFTSDTTVEAFGTQLDGSIENQGGTVKTVSCYDGAFNPL